MSTVDFDLTEELHQQREHPTTCRRHQKPSWRVDARCPLCIIEDS
jgi:hypothetical protein